MIRNGDVVVVADYKEHRNTSKPLSQVNYNGEALEVYMEKLEARITALESANVRLKARYLDMAEKLISLTTMIQKTNTNITLVEYDFNSLQQSIEEQLKEE